MSHQINRTAAGDAFFSARVPAWHRLGTVTPGCLNWKDALKVAKINYLVERRQLIDPITRNPIPAYGTFRCDTGEFLGQVGPEYQVIQNGSIGDVLDAIVEAKGGAHYETAGALGRGERVFALVNLKEAIKIKGTDDLSDTYLLGVTAHDGSMSNRYYMTSVRVVCANTLAMAENAQAGKVEFRIRHTGEIDAKLAMATEVLLDAKKGIKSLSDKLNYLATKEATKPVIQDVLGKTFPKLTERKAGDDGKMRFTPAAVRQQNVAREVLTLYEKNDDNAIPKIRGTAYNLLNAFTEFADHEKSVRQGGFGSPEAARAFQATFGPAAEFKQDALSFILSSVDFAPASSLDRIIGAVNVG